MWKKKRHQTWKRNFFLTLVISHDGVPGSRSRSKTAQDLSGLSGFPARFERFERFGPFGRFFFFGKTAQTAQILLKKPLKNRSFLAVIFERFFKQDLSGFWAVFPGRGPRLQPPPPRPNLPPPPPTYPLNVSNIQQTPPPPPPTYPPPQRTPFQFPTYPFPAPFQFPTPLVKLQNKAVHKMFTRQFAC